MSIDDILYYVNGLLLLVMAGITVWAVMTPGQALYVG